MKTVILEIHIVIHVFLFSFNVQALLYLPLLQTQKASRLVIKLKILFSRKLVCSQVYKYVVTLLLFFFFK